MHMVPLKREGGLSAKEIFAKGLSEVEMAFLQAHLQLPCGFAVNLCFRCYGACIRFSCSIQCFAVE